MEFGRELVCDLLYSELDSVIEFGFYLPRYSSQYSCCAKVTRVLGGNERVVQETGVVRIYPCAAAPEGLEFQRIRQSSHNLTVRYTVLPCGKS